MHRNGPSRALRLMVVTALSIAAAAVAPSASQAASQDFCGSLVSSSTGLYDFCTLQTSASYRWTYVSSSYRGGGNIRRMRVHMRYRGGARFNTYWFVDYATFLNGCWYGNFGATEPLINQEDNGAPHTLYGYTDDSTNHTGCTQQVQL
jgi:hypothetical protein